jgi:hypothetical protein
MHELKCGKKECFVIWSERSDYAVVQSKGRLAKRLSALQVCRNEGDAERIVAWLGGLYTTQTPHMMTEDRFRIVRTTATQAKACGPCS